MCLVPEISKILRAGKCIKAHPLALCYIEAHAVGEHYGSEKVLFPRLFLFPPLTLPFRTI